MRAWSLVVQRNACIGVAAIQVPDSTGAVRYTCVNAGV
jgi:hypothetical protein